jgi:tRNA(Ile)-lysidine synthase
MVPSAKPETPLRSLFEVTTLPAANHYFLAFSGGLDSMVLLHHLRQDPDIKCRLSAIHVNHHIHPDSNQWASHCARVCRDSGVSLITASVNLPNRSENAAREARYQQFEQILTAQDVLLTAHHLNDQLETVLFRLLRGTGLHGLTAMQAVSHRDHYRVCRPLLNTPREQLEHYAQHHRLKWIFDPNNDNPDYSRNRLRHQVLPALLAYHPDSLKNLRQTRDNLQHSLALLTTLLGQQNPLPMDTYRQPELLATALYHWLHARGLSPASHLQLLQFARDCLQSGPDKSPQLVGHDYCLVMWQQQIHALRLIKTDPEALWSITLQAGEACELPSGQGSLLLESDEAWQLEVEVRFQQCGERLLLPGHQRHKKLKKLYQENAIPPWIRSAMPMLYIDDQLMACGDQLISRTFDRLLSQHNAQYHWRSPRFLL